MKWNLYYLIGTTDIGLVYDRGSNTYNNIIGYVDFDYAGDLDWWSLTGYVFTLLDCTFN